MRLLGDPTRVRILALLARHELAVAELARRIGAPPNTISQQLRLLRALGWVAARREGRRMLYHIVTAEFDRLLAELDRVRALLYGGQDGEPGQFSAASAD